MLVRRCSTATNVPSTTTIATRNSPAPAGDGPALRPRSPPMIDFNPATFERDLRDFLTDPGSDWELDELDDALLQATRNYLDATACAGARCRSSPGKF